MFVALFPGLDLLNIMRLHSPQSAILSAVIFNALVIVALIPLALRGVRYTPEQRVKAVEPQPLHLRARRHHRAVHRHQADRPRHPILTGNVTMKFSNFVRQHWAALRALLVLTVIVGLAYPLFIWLVASDARPAGQRQRVDHRGRRKARGQQA